MKTTLLLAAIVAIALIAVAVFLLFPSKGPIEESWSIGTSQVTEEGETTTEESIRGQRIYGNISEIGKDYITIEGLKLKITERTRVYEGTEEISLDDLRVGDYVRIDSTDNFEAFSIYRRA